MFSNRHFNTWTALILAAVLFFAVNLWSNAALTSTRVDLTENRLYTLTEGTRNILAGLEEPIVLRLFLSQQQATRLPGIGSYALRVKELLREYERQADGAIKLYIVDPEPFSEEEDRAEAYGVRGIPVDDSGTLFYFGLAGTNSTDDDEVIPFFSPDREALLEHDLTTLVHQLSASGTTTVGLLSTLPLDGGAPGPQAMVQGMQPPWVVLDQMRQLFNVVTVEPEAERIPEDVDVLMVVHPRQLPGATLYAIDQYVLERGRALVFVDPYAEADRLPGMMGMGSPPGSSDLGPLLDKWGVELVAGKVAGDLSTAERVRFGQNQAVIDYPLWMNLPVDQNNPDDPVTAKLGNLVFASPGILNDTGAEGTEVTPLVWTTENAARFDASELAFLTDPTTLLAGYRPEGAALNLAVRVAGPVETAYPDGPPPPPKTDDENQQETAAAGVEASTGPHLDRSRQDVNLIVVADTDLLSDDFWVQTQNLLGTRLLIPTAANGDFVINALENLLGSNDLISVRSRGQFSRPFTKVAEIQQAAEIQYRQKEQELLRRLRETEDKLVDLERGKQEGQSLILTDEQEQEIARFRQEKLRIRQELREVRHQLHKDIERLEGFAKFVNIGFMPLVIGIGGLVIGVRRTHRRRRSRERAGAG